MKVVQQRAKDYAPPKVNFKRTARLWNAYLDGTDGKEIDEESVAIMMILLKISRLMHKYTKDQTLDIKGYAECIDLLNED